MNMMNEDEGRKMKGESSRVERGSRVKHFNLLPAAPAQCEGACLAIVDYEVVDVSLKLIMVTLL